MKELVEEYGGTIIACILGGIVFLLMFHGLGESGFLTGLAKAFSGATF